jgi:hypothetical protein
MDGPIRDNGHRGQTGSRREHQGSRANHEYSAPAPVASLAEARFRTLIGKRIVYTDPDGRTLTGRVLPGLGALRCMPDGTRWIRIRSREVWYARLDLAPALRLAPAKKRRAA